MIEDAKNASVVSGTIIFRCDVAIFENETARPFRRRIFDDAFEGRGTSSGRRPGRCQIKARR